MDLEIIRGDMCSLHMAKVRDGNTEYTNTPVQQKCTFATGMGPNQSAAVCLSWRCAAPRRHALRLQ